MRCGTVGTGITNERLFSATSLSFVIGSGLLTLDAFEGGGRNWDTWPRDSFCAHREMKGKDETIDERCAPSFLLRGPPNTDVPQVSHCWLIVFDRSAWRCFLVGEGPSP